MAACRSPTAFKRSTSIDISVFIHSVTAIDKTVPVTYYNFFRYSFMPRVLNTRPAGAFHAAYLL
jgi:hypothetical protein